MLNVFKTVAKIPHPLNNTTFNVSENVAKIPHPQNNTMSNAF